MSDEGRSTRGRTRAPGGSGPAATPPPTALPPRPDFRPVQRAKRAPCMAGCPNHTDVRGCIGVIAQRHRHGWSLDEALDRAWRMVTDVNPFPAALGRICPHPCQDGCNRSNKDGQVSINALERYVGDHGIHTGLRLTRLLTGPMPESIGVIGAGPAGLSFAYQMARRGYTVTVYERSERPGGMLRYGIPNYRLPPSVLDAEIRRILELGVVVETGTAVGEDVSVAELRARHHTLFVGIGAQKGRRLGIPGEDGFGVWRGTDYLRAANIGQPVPLTGTVVVVGGGNTAVDAARMARRAGARVIVLYRRTRDEMPASDEEVDAMHWEGVRIEFLASPVAIEREGNRVTGVRAQRMELGTRDASGRRSPVPIPDSEFTVEADAVVVAVSQAPDWSTLDDLSPGDGVWSPAPEAGPGPDGVWYGGDVEGLGIASRAIARGRFAAEALHARLRGLPEPERDTSPPIQLEDRRADFFKDTLPTRRPHLLPDIALADPGVEVQGPLTGQEFLTEIERCFSCGLCFGCEHCAMFCSAGAFTRRTDAVHGAYFELDLTACESCGKCVDVCPCGFLEVRANGGPDRTASINPGG